VSAVAAGRSALSRALQSDILNLDVSGLFGGSSREQDGKGSCLMDLSAEHTMLFGYDVSLSCRA
jgi:hypothetical protein